MSFASSEIFRLVHGSRRRVALYCSDVSGAFDRVNPVRLQEKLLVKGLHPRIVKVIGSWLAARNAVVAVDGIKSVPQPLQHSVYQGTVLGPPLRNCYYEDARLATQAAGYSETVFADDLNYFKAFDADASDASILDDLSVCQAALHQWGSANQVLFDAKKESCHILHPQHPWGDDFKMLGISFDTRLVMRRAAYEIAARAGSMVKRILRCRRVFSASSLIALYKTHVLSYVEYNTPAVFHAPLFFLSAIDAIQDQFCDDLGLSAEEVLLQHNLAPLRSRRCIAMLGLLHKIVLGKSRLSICRVRILRASPQ